MLKNTIKFFAFALVSVGMLQAADYNVDKEATKIGWHAEKVTGEHEGYVNIKSGSFDIDKGMIEDGECVIDMKSIICTDIEDEGYRGKLESHLKSEDFFSVDKHPEAKFEVTKVEKKADKQHVTCNLTIKGITHEVTIPVKVTVSQDMVTAMGTLKIDRSKFNVKYNSKSFFDIEALGDKMIYDEFTINLHLVAKK